MATGKFATWVEKEGGSNVVAEKLGVTGAAVRYWLRGNYSPQAVTIMKILKLAKGDVSFEDIVKESRRNYLGSTQHTN